MICPTNRVLPFVCSRCKGRDPLPADAGCLGGADDRFVSSANLREVGRPQTAMVCPTNRVMPFVCSRCKGRDPLPADAGCLGGADDRFVSSANLREVGRPQTAMICPTNRVLPFVCSRCKGRDPLPAAADCLGGADDRFVSSAKPARGWQTTDCDGPPHQPCYAVCEQQM
jgi:hypothetical protein